VRAFKSITLEDKQIIDSYFSAKHYENSEYSFTNLFMWAPHYYFKYAIIKDHLCIIGSYRNQYPFAFNPWSKGEADYESIIPKLAEIMAGSGNPLVLKYISEDIKNEIDKAMPGRFIFREDRNNFDYIYLTKDLINLEGNKYHQKRNHINKFINSYEYEYEEINDKNIDDCIRLEMEWHAQRSSMEKLPEEHDAIKLVLSNYKSLDLKGAALRINGKIQAFTVGGLLNPNMAVIHIEKANIEYNGIYAMINQQFAANAWSNVKYINREEDMGIPGLRKSKLSYHPYKMGKKYIGFYI